MLKGRKSWNQTNHKVDLKTKFHKPFSGKCETEFSE